jgi:hypothetical protein
VDRQVSKYSLAEHLRVTSCRRRLPGGTFFVVLALLFTGVLVTKLSLGGFMVLSVNFALALLNWLWAFDTAELPGRPPISHS